MGGGLSKEELDRVQKFISNSINGSVAPEARPAASVRRRAIPTDPRTAKRERAADWWLAWFRRAVREAGTEDPATLLPDMAAKLEERDDASAGNLSSRPSRSRRRGRAEAEDSLQLKGRRRDDDF